MNRDELEMVVGFALIVLFCILVSFFPNTMIAMLIGYLIGWKARNDREKSS